eukprot:m.31751 g.31751  ORF g.31751 m.31751 type:complete len:463 (-) comp9341_c0_seq1:69-1457(-)
MVPMYMTRELPMIARGAPTYLERGLSSTVTDLFCTLMSQRKTEAFTWMKVLALLSAPVGLLVPPTVVSVPVFIDTAEPILVNGLPFITMSNLTMGVSWSQRACVPSAVVRVSSHASLSAPRLPSNPETIKRDWSETASKRAPIRAKGAPLGTSTITRDQPKLFGVSSVRRQTPASEREREEREAASHCSFAPPNTYMLLLMLRKAATWPQRSSGQSVLVRPPHVGKICDQVPRTCCELHDAGWSRVKIQVSLKMACVFCPPKMRARLLCSRTAVWPARAEGDGMKVSGWSRSASGYHWTKSKSKNQVSLRKAKLVPASSSLRPPKTTIKGARHGVVSVIAVWKPRGAGRAIFAGMVTHEFEDSVGKSEALTPLTCTARANIARSLIGRFIPMSGVVRRFPAQEKKKIRDKRSKNDTTTFDFYVSFFLQKKRGNQRWRREWRKKSQKEKTDQRGAEQTAIRAK